MVVQLTNNLACRPLNRFVWSSVVVDSGCTYRTIWISIYEVTGFTDMLVIFKGIVWSNTNVTTQCDKLHKLTEVEGAKLQKAASQHRLQRCSGF